jgi:two-component system KDP operon response regulator KdpE
LRLGLEGHTTVASASDLPLALSSVRESSPDAIVLHHIPDARLRELVRALRERTAADLIVIPAEYSEDDLVYYLGEGVTEYLTRPLTPRALSARIQALHQRRPPSGDPIGATGDIELDPANRAVRRGGDFIPLTPIEYRLLEKLLRHRGRSCSHQALLEEVWGPGFTDRETYLRIYIRFLRRKLEVDPHKPELLLTVRGFGYRLADAPAPAAAPAREAKRAQTRMSPR